MEHDKFNIAYNRVITKQKLIIRAVADPAVRLQGESDSELFLSTYFCYFCLVENKMFD